MFLGCLKVLGVKVRASTGFRVLGIFGGLEAGI